MVARPRIRVPSGLVLGAFSLLSLGLLWFVTGSDAEKTPVQPARVSAITLDSNVVRSEPPVLRAAAPVAPGGLPSALASVPRPGQATAPANTLAAPAVLAAANTVWSEMLGAMNISFAPLQRADPKDWGMGGCRNLPQPPGPAYCMLDQKLYVEETVRPAPRAMFDLAHEIGHHVQLQLGVLLPPLAEAERLAMSDCFAGIWARANRDLVPALFPERIERFAMLGETPDLVLQTRSRSFARGYVGAGLRACLGSAANRL